MELIKPSGAKQALELRAHNDEATRARQRTVHCYKCNVDHISSDSRKWQTALVGTSKGKNTIAEPKSEVNFEEAKDVEHDNNNNKEGIVGDKAETLMI